MLAQLSLLDVLDAAVGQVDMCEIRQVAQCHTREGRQIGVGDGQRCKVEAMQREWWHHFQPGPVINF